MASRKLERLRNRRTDPVLKSVAGITEAYANLSEDDAVKYAIGAMQPIDPDYTARTVAEGERVREQLQKRLRAIGQDVEHRYQGSVTNNTHIKAHSDIDLLVLNADFISLQPPLVPSAPYKGDALGELRSLRTKVIQMLKDAFPAVTVDGSGGKCVALSGGSLQRKIDVVISNWWNTVEYDRNPIEVWRGVKIYDATAHDRIENKPFLHNQRIDERDRATNGSMRKVARLLKSLKYDADPEVRISSYDIASLAYRMPDSFLTVGAGQDLLLVSNAETFLGHLLANEAIRIKLTVPNEMRPIFGARGASVDSLRDLHREVATLRMEIEQGLARSFRKLAEARISI